MAALFNIVKSFVDSGLSDWLKEKVHLPMNKFMYIEENIQIKSFNM